MHGLSLEWLRWDSPGEPLEDACWPSLAHDWDRSDSLAVILFEIKPSGDLGECIFDVFVHVCSPFIEQC